MKITIAHEELNKALSLTAFAASTDATRYYMNGVILEVDDGVARLVSTDGLRMSVYELQDVHHGDNPPAREQYLIPVDTAKAWLKDKPARGMGGERVTLEATELSITRRATSAQSTHPLIDGSFPDWRRILPDITHEPVCTAPARFNAAFVGQLAAALKSAKLSASVRLTTTSDGNGPIFFDTEVEGFTHVIMPVRFKSCS